MHIAIVGATGAVGQEALALLEKSHLSIDHISLLASKKSVGKKFTFRKNEIAVQELQENSFRDVDIALFCCGSSISKKYRDIVLSSDAILVDNSSAFRMEDDVPLIIPEINLEELNNHKGIIAIPNCSTILMLMVVAPIHRLLPVSKITVSTYQAVSGAGMSAIHELSDSSQAFLNGQKHTPNVFPHPIAFNLFSHDSKVNPEGYNEEETKMISETKKILKTDSIDILPTCIRVPIFRSHSMSIALDFENEVPFLKEVHDIFENSYGIEVVDDVRNNHFPMPINSNGSNYCFVGRIRKSTKKPHSTVLMFVTGDQLLKGAAFNAIQIIHVLCDTPCFQYEF